MAKGQGHLDGRLYTDSDKLGQAKGVLILKEINMASLRNIGILL
jgi:hypothetical protein